jgi:hypothetical protein
MDRPPLLLFNGIGANLELAEPLNASKPRSSTFQE